MKEKRVLLTGVVLSVFTVANCMAAEALTSKAVEQALQPVMQMNSVLKSIAQSATNALEGGLLEGEDFTGGQIPFPIVLVREVFEGPRAGMRANMMTQLPMDVPQCLLDLGKPERENLSRLHGIKISDRESTEVTTADGGMRTEYRPAILIKSRLEGYLIPAEAKAKPERLLEVLISGNATNICKSRAIAVYRTFDSRVVGTYRASSAGAGGDARSSSVVAAIVTIPHMKVVARRHFNGSPASSYVGTASGGGSLATGFADAEEQIQKWLESLKASQESH